MIIMNNEWIKPPIGLIPKFISDLQRLEEVKSAIKRYCNVGLPIPPEWIEEYNELSKITLNSCGQLVKYVVYYYHSQT